MPKQDRRIVPRCARAVGAGVLTLFAIVGTWQSSDGSWSITAGAALAVIVLWWRREKPDAVLGVHLVLCALQLGVTDSPLPADLTIVVSLYAAGRWGERGLTPVWAIAVVVGSTLGAWDWNRDELGIVPLSLWAQDMAQAAFAQLCSAAIAWGLGRFVTQRRQLRASRLTAEEQRRAAHDAALRNEIAREVHDVVGHALALIAVQAEAGHYLAAGSEDIDLPADERLEQAAQALGQIRATAHSALADTRSLTRTLASSPQSQEHRSAAEPNDARPASPVAETPLRPVPRIADLPRIVDDVRATGLPVTLSVDDRLISEGEQTGGRSPLSAQAELALYRTTQESLTNVLKHAEAAAVEVRLEYRDDEAHKEVVLTVADQPSAHDTGALTPRAGGRLPSSEQTPADTGGGQGLVNLRQRLAAVGGSLEAGPGPGGGFIVRARIPSEAPQSTVVTPGGEPI